MEVDNLTIEEIKSKLNNYSIDKVDNPYPPNFLESTVRPAAVLIPLLRKDHTWHILFIRRTVMEADRHSGQVAFPGGACDPGDGNAEAAALRETEEELGIDPQDIRILGKLNEHITITNFAVTPVVGVIPWPYELNLAPDEVDRAFTIPLPWLFDPLNRKITKRSIPDGPTLEVIYFNEYDGEVLWGASARFTLTFLNAISTK